MKKKIDYFLHMKILTNYFVSMTRMNIHNKIKFGSTNKHPVDKLTTWPNYKSYLYLLSK